MKQFNITYHDMFEGTYTVPVIASSIDNALKILSDDLGYVNILKIEEV